jgi:hypothetical protein
LDTTQEIKEVLREDKGGDSEGGIGFLFHLFIPLTRISLKYLGQPKMAIHGSSKPTSPPPDFGDVFRWIQEAESILHVRALRCLFCLFLFFTQAPFPKGGEPKLLFLTPASTASAARSIEDLKKEALARLHPLEAENGACTLPMLADKQEIHTWLYTLRKRLMSARSP